MLVVARAAAHSGFGLSVLAAELREAGGSLDVFDSEDQATNVRAVFSWSYQRLSTPGRRLFRLLGLHYGPDVTRSRRRQPGRGAQGTDPARAGRAGPRASRRRANPGTVRLPRPATRVRHRSRPYARLRRVPLRRRRHRVLDHYLHSAYRADELLGRQQDRPFTLVDALPEVTPEIPDNQKQALAWFESEHAVLLAALRQATGFDTHIWQLAWTLASYFEYQGHWRDWRDSQKLALDASQRLSDQLAQALSQRSLGCAFVQLSRYDHAHTHLQDALRLFGGLGDNARPGRRPHQPDVDAGATGPIPGSTTSRPTSTCAGPGSRRTAPVRPRRSTPWAGFTLS